MDCQRTVIFRKYGRCAAAVDGAGCRMPGQFCTTCVPNYFNGKCPCSGLQASWRIVKGLS